MGQCTFETHGIASESKMAMARRNLRCILHLTTCALAKTISFFGNLTSTRDVFLFSSRLLFVHRQCPENDTPYDGRAHGEQRARIGDRRFAESQLLRCSLVAENSTELRKCPRVPGWHLINTGKPNLSKLF